MRAVFYRNRRVPLAAMLLGTGASGVLLSPVALASAQGQADEPAAATVRSSDTVTEKQARLYPASDVVRRIARGSGATVLADSSVAAKNVPLPTEATTPQNLEKQLDDLVRALGRGATWAKLYLPAPPAGRSAYDPDAVADFAMAQARLFGTVGGTAPAGAVEVLGQRIPADKAPSYVDGLNLRTIYLVTNPGMRAAQGNAAQHWNDMTADEQRQYAQSQASQLANADNATRQAFLMQNIAVMKAMMQQLTPEQQQQMFQGTGMLFKVRTAPPDGSEGGK